jgi:toluene monooxygenase system ferredoxin subunit
MWHTVMAEDDLREGGNHRHRAGIEVARKKLALFNVGGEIGAFEDRCPTSVPDSVRMISTPTR